MTWPDDGTTLPVVVEAAFGADLTADPATWTWTDLTARLEAVASSLPIRIRRGRSSPGAPLSPGSCTVTLDNTDGALTPLHPMSPYWPNVELGTPLRVRVLWDGVYHDRLSGFADQWQPTYVPTTDGSYVSAVRVTVSGVLRRVGQGTPPVRSPIRRRAGSPQNVGLLAYWPLEDAPDSTQGASAVAGVPPMTVAGTVEFGAGDVNLSAGGTSRFGTMPLPSLTAGGGLGGTVPAGTSSPVGWAVQLFWQAADGNDDDVVLVSWSTPGGTFVRWEFIQDRGGVDGTYLVAYTSTGVATVVWSTPSTLTGPADLVITAVQSGGNINVTVMFGSPTPIGSVSVAGTLARIGSVALNPNRFVFSPGERFIVGHLRVWDTASVVPLTTAQTRGDPGELAHVRLPRLAAEDGITLTVPAVSAGDGTAMGSQPDGVPLDLYQECVDADLGVLYEDGFGLGYLPRALRYNPAAALTIDLSTYRTAADTTGEVLQPSYDDLTIRNQWTVERPGGSSATAADAASQGRHGVYADSVQLNVAGDDQLADQASWRVHLDANLDLREDAVPIDLLANPDLIDGWLSCGVGSRIVRTNPPPQHRPGDLDQIVEGWTEVLGPRMWRVSVTPSAAAPWFVAVVDGDQRVAADGSTLAATLTDADVVPASAWTFTAGVEGWTALNGTVAWNSGQQALTFTPNGSSASGEPRSPNTPGVTPTTWWYATALVSCAVSRTVNISLLWRDAGGALLSTTTAAFALTAGVQQRLSVVGQAPASTAQAMVALPMGGTPPASNVLTVYEADLTPLQSLSLASTAANGVWTTDPADMPLDVRVGAERVRVVAISGTSSPQTARVSARGLNGVRRSWSAGTEVDVWFPAIVAL